VVELPVFPEDEVAPEVELLVDDAAPSEPSEQNDGYWYG
tara:strand:+ start:73 stop:189 length:117 start_codon:yes stop_codon:yes gene_type:complete